MEFTRQNVPPLYLQVAAHLKKRIADGELRDGEKLPATAELAAHYRVTLVTAQKSLKLLENQGLVERKRRTGTIVRGCLTANTVGILYPTGRKSLFQHRFFERLAELAVERNFNVKIYFQLAPSLRARLLYEIRDDATAGKLRILIAPFGVLSDTEAAELCPEIPLMQSPPFDFRSWTRLGMTYLYRRGYRRIRMISQIANLDTEHARSLFAAELAGATEAAQEFNAEFTPADLICAGGGRVEDGFRCVSRLLGTPAKFDALFVNHDALTPGALLAIYAAGLSIPRDLGFLTHANAGEGADTPVPLTRLVYNPDRDIYVMLDRARELLHLNNPCDVTTTPVTEMSLEPGGSCGENLQIDGKNEK